MGSIAYSGCNMLTLPRHRFAPATSSTPGQAPPAMVPWAGSAPAASPLPLWLAPPAMGDPGDTAKTEGDPAKRKFDEDDKHNVIKQRRMEHAACRRIETHMKASFTAVNEMRGCMASVEHVVTLSQQVVRHQKKQCMDTRSRLQKAAGNDATVKLTKECENCAGALTWAAVVQETHLEEMDVALETVKDLCKRTDADLVGPWADIPDVRANEPDAA